MDGNGIEPAAPEVELVTQRRTIVTALPLEPAARRRLAELLEARVVDVREPIDAPDMVLSPPCSPQLIEALGRKYNGARVVVVELDDWAHHIELAGPVKRILRSGASAYVLADSIEELAAKIANRSGRDAAAPAAVAGLPSSAPIDELIAAFLRHSVEDSTVTEAPESSPGLRDAAQRPRQGR